MNPETAKWLSKAEGDYHTARRELRAQGAGPFHGSDDFLTVRDLSEAEECFDQLAFAADRHLGESLEPSAVRDFGLGLCPVRKKLQLPSRDFALPALKGFRPKPVVSSGLSPVAKPDVRSGELVEF